MLEPLFVARPEILMTATSPFVILRRPCDEAVAWAILKLEQSRFQTMRTFDLRAARLAHLDCPCPHHGTAQCNCQMVVLLVYQENNPPTSLVIHGSEETSWFYLINTPQQPSGQLLEKNIREVLSLEMHARI
jgi:hypothetical protein